MTSKDFYRNNQILYVLLEYISHKSIDKENIIFIRELLGSITMDHYNNIDIAQDISNPNINISDNLIMKYFLMIFSFWGNIIINIYDQNKKLSFEFNNIDKLYKGGKKIINLTLDENNNWIIMGKSKCD